MLYKVRIDRIQPQLTSESIQLHSLANSANSANSANKLLTSIPFHILANNIDNQLGSRVE